ncbi:2-oxo acid dehydrogenase subunit E2 [Candidatus Sumerlaeota bacterium]|nr:2-oxo acid dehydrogenase subunit E2 [Candidatus Sumerlaeota bacterium]
MPQPDQMVEECVLARWLVRPGDQIEKGQVIFEAETTKAVFEVEAERSGRLARIVVGEDQCVPVMTAVAYLAENDAVLDAWLAASPAQQAAVRSEPSAQAAIREKAHLPETVGAPGDVEPSDVKASPAARALAKERGIDLTAIGSGSGPQGRITVADVENAIAAAARTDSDQPARRPMTPMRRAVARIVTASKQTIPHFYVKTTVEAKAAIAFCESHKADLSCGLNDVIVMASAKAVREFPAFRSRLDGNDIVTLPSANIGIVVATEDGLVVPVARDADRMTLEQLARETKRIIAAARAGKVEGHGAGVFTVSNLGMYGVEEFSAIIHPPEAAILAVGVVREQVVVRNGVLSPSHIMTLTLSCDHRLIDGVQAAQFLARLKHLIENPSQLARAD